MSFKPRVYRNSTELANLNGIPIYMDNMVDAALRGRLNTFLQGDTGSGKTQLVRDVMGYFGNNSVIPVLEKMMIHDTPSKETKRYDVKRAAERSIEMIRQREIELKK